MRIGIVTAAFDAADTIGDAVRSVLTQSYPSREMIVVDDGSRDATAAIAAGLGARVLCQANAGVSAARNAGLARLDCDAVLFLDADDWLAPDALARLVATLDHAPDAVAAYGAFAFVAGDARPGAARVLERSGRLPSGDVLRALLERNRLANGGHVLVRRTAIDAAGGFRTDLAYGEDWECWVRLALLGPFLTVGAQGLGGRRQAEPLLYVRRRAAGVYLRLASQPEAFGPCMTAIFGNPALRARLGEAACARWHRRALAENDWIVGRELIRHGRRAEGVQWLLRSVRAKPGAKRAALLAAAHALPAVRRAWHGPFRPYA